MKPVIPLPKITAAALTLTAVLCLSSVQADAKQASAGAPPAAPAGKEYHLGTGDKVRVIVFGEASLSGEFIVSDTGAISFPLVGAIPATGLTLAQFQEGLRSKLADGYLRDPRVSAEVLNFRPFYILGEVQKPGEYPYTSGLTVMNAVATAGGFSYRANTRSIVVRHANATKDDQVDLTTSTQVAPGDTIRIKERFF